MRNLFVLAVFLLSVSCSSTSVISTWTKPGTVPDQLSSYMVMAIVGSNNPGLQQKMEEGVVAELVGRGYKATSYFRENGPRGVDQESEQAALAQISKAGAQAILTIVLLDTAQEHNYVPGRVDYYPVAYYQRFWGYYGTVYNRTYTPGYYTTSTRLFWETNVYRAADQELVYSVRTESFDPSSRSSLAEQYGRIIVKDMARGGLISRK